MSRFYYSKDARVERSLRHSVRDGVSYSMMAGAGETYLSAYAHNSNILVKEGQNVTKGQKIAEVGNTDAPQAKLHFEIRRLGKPVDPAKYLPDRPS